MVDPVASQDFQVVVEVQKVCKWTLMKSLKCSSVEAVAVVEQVASPRSEAMTTCSLSFLAEVHQEVAEEVPEAASPEE